jgi:aminomethyltransferase
MVTGPDALDVLRGALTGAVDGVDEGRARRVVLLDERGKIADLVLVARVGGVAYLVSGEPERRAVLVERLQASVRPDFEARLDDRTETTCALGVAGPGAAELVARFVAEGLPGRLGPLHCVAFEFHGFRALAVRTSGTGDDGFELVLAPAVASHLLGTLRAGGVALAGHQALEVARVESCIPAWEPDLAPGLSPAEADLDVLLGVPSGSQGRILSAFVLEGPPVRPGTAVTDAAGQTVGEVRSCVAAWGLKVTAGLAIMEAATAFPGAGFAAGGARLQVVAKPLFRRRTKENRQQW